MGPFRGGNQRGSSQRGRGGSHGRGGRGGSRFGGPKLPSTLLSEVDTTYGAGRNSNGRSLTRKEQRKVDRRPNQAGSSRQTRDASVSDQEDQEEEPIPPPKLSKKAQGKRPAREEEEPAPIKKKRKLPELSLPGPKEDDAEDQEIEWLEWMLKKEKKKAQDDDLSDGLDDILDFADVIGPGGSGLNQDEEDAESDDMGSEMDDEDLLSDDEEDLSDEDEDGNSSADEEGSASDQDLNAEDDQDSDEDKDDVQAEITAEGKEEWQGIESPTSPHEEEGAPVEATRYIPPHLRAAALAEKAAGDKGKIEERRKLDRKAQGILNKLSEANIESLIGEIEQLYRGYSRNDVTTTLTTLIMEMVGSRSNLLDSFVVLYATLVGSLHRIIGLEFGAHFVHTLVTRHHQLYHNPSSSSTPLEASVYETPDASKEALNLLTLIAELYNAGVVGSGLIYDLIRGFLSTDVEGVLGEREVEALLKILRCSGPQLRSDDPASLKDIVGLVQDKAKGKESDMTTRARFMIETLVNVKNGKGKTGNGAEQSNDAAARMKKFLSGLGKKRRLLASEPLRVSLTDLLNADKKGKWWLVGAGWSGNPLVEHEQQPVRQVQEADDTEEAALYDLARKQGMNTDVRRSVFVVLLTSEDYVHACDRLSHLRFTQVQQRECVRVTLHCCALEKQYNPYYTLVLNNLCAESYDHRFTLQYALWDFIRELGGPADKSTKRKASNVAKAMAFVVARGSMDLTVFKGVEWTDLNPATNNFLALFLIHLVLGTQTVSPLFTLPKAFRAEAIDDEAIEDVFGKTLTDSKLASGFAIVLRMELGPKKLGKHVEQCGFAPREQEVIRSGLKIGQAIVARGM